MLSDISDNSVLFDTEDIEMNSLGKRSAFSNGDNISLLDSEAWRAVSNDVSMSLLISVILLNIVEIVSSNNDSVFHLVGRDGHGSKDLSSDVDISSEWTFLVNVVSLNSFFGSFESETDVSEISDSFSSLGEEEFLVVVEDSGLFLIGLFFLLDHV